MALVIVAAFALAVVFFGKKLPSSFLPDEDQGYMYVQMQLPEASSLQATSDAAREVEAVLKDTPGVKYTSSVMGFSLLSLTRTSYNAFFWVTLQPWEDRKHIDEQFQVIKAKLNLKLLTLPRARSSPSLHRQSRESAPRADSSLCWKTARERIPNSW